MLMLPAERRVKMPLNLHPDLGSPRMRRVKIKSGRNLKTMNKAICEATHNRATVRQLPLHGRVQTMARLPP